MGGRLLILHPEKIMGKESTFARVLPFARSLEPMVELDVSRKCNPNYVRQTILSGDFSVILVCDLSRDQKWFTFQFRSCLRAFTHAGGSVAFVAHALPPVVRGYLVYSVIRPIFHFEWNQGENHRGPIRYISSHTANYWFDDGAAPPTFEGHFNLVKDVDPSDVVYRFAGVCGDGAAAVAVGKYGRGAVAYFGDVRGEEDMFCVVLLFLTNAKAKSRIQQPLLDPMVEKPLQIWAAGATHSFLSGNDWELFAGFGFYFDDFSGLPVVCGPLEGMETERSVNLRAMRK